jgi:hypothetical protein
LKNDISHPFLDFLGIDMIRDKESINPKTIMELCDFANKSIFHDYVSTMKDESNDSTTCQKHLDFIKEAFGKFVESSPLLNKTMDLSNEKESYFSVNLEGPGIDVLVSSYSENLLSSFATLIGKTITSEGNIDIHSSEYFLSKEDIDTIITFAPDFMSFNSTIESYANDEQKAKIGNIKKCKQESLPPNLFWKKDAISINLVFDNKLSKFWPFNDDEVNKYLDKNYPSINGLYKFGSSDDINSFMVTRKWLFDHLSTNLFHCLIVFKFKVYVDTKGIFVIQKEPKCGLLDHPCSQEKPLIYIIQNNVLISKEKMINNDERNKFCFISDQKEKNLEFSIYYQGRNYGNSCIDKDSKTFASATGIYDNFKLNADGEYKIIFDTQTDEIKIEKK